MTFRWRCTLRFDGFTAGTRRGVFLSKSRCHRGARLWPRFVGPRVFCQERVSAPSRPHGVRRAEPKAKGHRGPTPPRIQGTPPGAAAARSPDALGYRKAESPLRIKGALSLPVVFLIRVAVVPVAMLFLYILFNAIIWRIIRR